MKIAHSSYGLEQTDLAGHIYQTKPFGYISKKDVEFLLRSTCNNIYKSRGEVLYRGNFNPNNLHIDKYFNVFNTFQNYIDKWFKEINIDLWEFEYAVKSETRMWVIECELFIKLVWLCDELINNQKFNNPIGVAFNPHTREYRIHPGGTRQRALHLFPPKSIEAFYLHRPLWNPHQLEEIFTSTPKKINSIFDLEPEFIVAFTPEFGTLIPHIMKDVEQIADHKKIWAGKIKNTLKNLKVVSNIKVPYLEKYYRDHRNLVCEIEFKDKSSRILNKAISKSLPLEKEDYHEFRRASILACRGVDYEDDNIKVTFKNLL